MHTISDDLKFMDAKLVVHISDLSLLSNIRFDPLCLDGLLALMIYELTAQLEAGGDEICAFQSKL